MTAFIAHIHLLYLSQYRPLKYTCTTGHTVRCTIQTDSLHKLIWSLKQPLFGCCRCSKCSTLGWMHSSMNEFQWLATDHSDALQQKGAPPAVRSQRLNYRPRSFLLYCPVDVGPCCSTFQRWIRLMDPALTRLPSEGCRYYTAAPFLGPLNIDGSVCTFSQLKLCCFTIKSPPRNHIC